MTVAASYGLTLSQVLALPFNIIDDMETLATDKENGHFVANFLNDEEYLKQNRHWIENMPAETLAKLLEVLCHYNYLPSDQLSFIEAMKKKRVVAATNNQNQRKAVNKILGWMCGTVPSQTNIRRFENALQRMGLDKPTELNKTEQWQRYAENIMKLREFFEQAFDDVYQNPNEKYDYMLDLDESFKEFKERIFLLTENTKIMQKISYSGHTGILETKEYSVYQSSGDEERYQMLKKQGFKLIDWMNLK